MYYQNLHYTGTLDIKNNEGLSMKGYPKEVIINDKDCDYSKFSKFFSYYFCDLLVRSYAPGAEINSDGTDVTHGDNSEMTAVAKFNVDYPESLFEAASNINYYFSFTGAYSNQT